MKKSGNKISVLGALIIVFSFLFFSFAEYRPNRVLTGTDISAKELFGNGFFLLLFISIILVVLTVLNKRSYKLMIGMFILFIVGLVLYLLGSALNDQAFNQTAAGRMSIGGGFWVLLLGVFMVLSGSFKGYGKAILQRRLFYLAIFLIIVFFLLSGHLDKLSIMKEFFNRSHTFFRQFNRHFSLAFFSVLVSILIGIPTGILIYKSKRTNNPLLFLINLGQTIPTLSLLGLIMVPLTFLGERSEFLRNIGIKSVGFTPAFLVLIIYALFPIVHNTIAGLNMIDQNLLEIASGMGMKGHQSFWKVQLPLSLPVILGGIRTAMTQSIGNTILAGLIGGGGLGSIIFLGLAQAAPDLILLGVIPLIAMAFMLDFMLSFFIFYYRKKVLGIKL
jgi:osmoprotectant transport system permease protein